MTNTRSSDDSIDYIRQRLTDDAKFLALLLQSLGAASAAGRAQLDPLLYAALDWPQTRDAYVTYLNAFARWIPQQSSEPPWTDPGTDEQQEVYDRLCHFYWLINQPVGAAAATTLQDIPWFSDWLVDYADLWGSFLDTTESFNDAVLHSFIDDSPKYRVQDSMIDGRPNNPSGWLTFNQFFARELNPGLRPIAAPMQNTVPTAPADCTFKACYEIAADSTIPGITVKKTHRFASIPDLLQRSDYANAFAGGTLVHYFLGPYSYHRFHAPVAGVLRECYPVRGRVYLDVNLRVGQFDAPDQSQGGYEFAQARGIVTIDTTGSPYGDIGVVAVIPVGMCQVSSVNMIGTAGQPTLKGDEFGYFLFGGSDIIVLFQAGVVQSVNQDGESYRLYGTQIAECTAK